MRAFVTRHERLSIGLVLLLGLLVRLPAVPFDLHLVNDVSLFMEWARTVHGPGFVTLSDGFPSGSDLYPPLSLWVLWAIGVIESLVPPSLRAGDHLVISLIKLLPVISDLCLAALIAWLVRPRGPVVAVIGAAAIALNPALIYLCIGFGQIDSVYTLMLVATVALLRRPRVASAWLTWAAACLIKVQGLLLAPLLLVVSLRDGGWRRTTVGIFLALCLVVLLLVPWLPSALPRYVDTMIAVIPRTNVWALNLWYLDGLGRRISDTHHILPFLTLRRIGYGLVLLVAAYVAVIAWYRGPRVGLALPAAVLGMAPFMVMTSMRGRYLLPALPFLVLLALGWDRRGVLPRAGLVAVVITSTLTINLLSFLPPDKTLWIMFTRPGTGGVLQPLVRAFDLGAAVANVVVFAWLLVSLARAARRSPDGEGGAPGEASIPDTSMPVSKVPAVDTIDR
jgi:dolichyl-phosphate-mannose-protein mannosyltransferase